MRKENKSLAATLECIFLGGENLIIFCSSKICNEVVRRYLGLDRLHHNITIQRHYWCLCIVILYTSLRLSVT